MENLDNPDLNTPFLCQTIGMGRTSLYNKLKTLTGMGSNDYINKLRMEKAISFLINNDMSITEVAEKVGFSNSRYFSTVFKQYTQETPTEYKQKDYPGKKGTVVRLPQWKCNSNSVWFLFCFKSQQI